MKRYDFAFSLGAACSCSQSLREAGLQFASYPFDWVGCPGILMSVDALVSGFDGWFRKEDLRLADVRREPLSTRCYLNRSTGFAFYHEFTLFHTFDEMFPKVSNRFRRREERLLQRIRESRLVLAAYVEVPFREQGTDADFLEAHRRLREAFPQTEFDLLVFRKGRKGLDPAVREIAPDVKVVEIDFVRYDDGVMSHQVDRSYMTRYLLENVRVPDGRSALERTRYAAEKRRERSDKWGGGGFLTRFNNQVSYKIYRRLTRYLVEQGIIPRERPVRY